MAVYLDDNYNIQANPLLDVDFLEKLHHVRVRQVHARVIALNSEEQPLELIEGVVTSGSVSVDGSSAVRRTCQLSMVVKELNIHEYYWGLKTKVEIYAGLENHIDDRYPDIIWFKQGTFVLTSFNTTQGLGNYTISLNGKDKMVLLNGELGGTITSLTHDFGTVKVTHVNGTTSEEKIVLKDIISSAVHTFAVMPFFKIHVRDLEDAGLELLEYRGKTPLYVIINRLTNELNLSLNGDQSYNGVKLSEIAVYNPLFDLEQMGDAGKQPTIISDSQGNQYTVAKIEYGMTAGYRLTDLVYAGDLILNVGDTITSMLDKIVNMLGEYEYFFDLDGNFVFQRKQVYLQTVWNDIRTNEQDERWVEPNAYSSAITYSFTDAELIHNYSNSPKLDNVRNDFSIWGTRKGVTGKEREVHLRFAIDDKPIEYVSYDNVRYTTLSLTESQIKQDLEERVQLSDDELEAKAIEKLLSDHSSTFYTIYRLLYNRKNYNDLPTEWWDLGDWAELWMAAVGYIPPQHMGVYSKSRAGNDFDITQYIPDSAVYKTAAHNWKLIHLKANGTVADTYHSTGCSHSYLEWYNAFQNGGRVGASTVTPGEMVYIFDPVLPDAVQVVIDQLKEQAIEEQKEEIKTGYIHTDLDWRELIYQMSQDYKKYHLEDDFYLTIYKHNPLTCPNGITGYEQYYTDLDAFWRDLYNKFYEGSYELVGMSRWKYLEAIKDWYPARKRSIASEIDTLEQKKIETNIPLEIEQYEKDIAAQQKKYDKLNPFTKGSFPYFYGMTEFLQGNISTPYRSTMQYYKQQINSNNTKIEYNPVSISKLEYELNPGIYYYVDPDYTQQKISCLEIEGYGDDNGKMWYTSANLDAANRNAYGRLQDTTTLSLTATTLSTETYTEIKNAYDIATPSVVNEDYWKFIGFTYAKCYYAEAIQTYYTYYYYDEEGIVQSVPGKNVNKELYYADPSKYWRYEYEYHQCTTDEPFDESKTYYVKGTANRTDDTVYTATKLITESRYNEDPTKYFTVKGGKQQRRCYRAKLPENYNEVFYFDSNFNTETATLHTVNDRFRNNNTNHFYTSYGHTDEEITTWLQNEIDNGYLPYCIYADFRPIAHPIDYRPGIGYYVFIDDEYKTDGWAPYVTEYPETLDFWFDFLDQDGELQKYSNKAIGNRPKAVNDNNVKSIYFRETPTLIFVDSESPENGNVKTGYTYVNLPSTDLTKLFSLSTQGKSAKTVLDGMLYKYACCADQITFNTLPYYHLQPNKRIFVACPESGITGEYIMTRFSVPLGPSGSMSITGVQAISALY